MIPKSRPSSSADLGGGAQAQHVEHVDVELEPLAGEAGQVHPQLGVQILQVRQPQRAVVVRVVDVGARGLAHPRPVEIVVCR